MLGVVSVLMPYLFLKIKNSKSCIQNSGHLIKIVGENTKNGKIAMVYALKYMKCVKNKIIY